MPVRCRIVLVSMEKQGGCGMIYLSVPDGAVFFMPKDLKPGGLKPEQNTKKGKRV